MTSRVFVVRRSPFARPLTAVIAAVLVSGALAGCTGFSIAGGCEPAFQPGDASSAVSATGDVEFPTPLIANETQRSVLVEGEGEPATPGSVILATYTYFDGATGQAGDETTAFFTASDAALQLGESLACVTVGSRLAVVGPVADVLVGAEGTEGTIVAVLDIEAIYLGKANGVNQLPQDGMPTVVTAVDGEPGITLTYQQAPEESRSAVIKAGSGATVEKGDTVIIHARNWSWPAGTGATPAIGQLDTWASGTPTEVDVDAEVLGDETVYEAFEGAKVGSQLLLVIPNTSGDGSATVVVIDILGILADE